MDTPPPIYTTERTTDTGGVDGIDGIDGVDGVEQCSVGGAFDSVGVGDGAGVGGVDGGVCKVSILLEKMRRGCPFEMHRATGWTTRGKAVLCNNTVPMLRSECRQNSRNTVRGKAAYVPLPYWLQKRLQSVGEGNVQLAGRLGIHRLLGALCIMGSWLVVPENLVPQPRGVAIGAGAERECPTPKEEILYAAGVTRGIGLNVDAFVVRFTPSEYAVFEEIRSRVLLCDMQTCLRTLVMLSLGVPGVREGKEAVDPGDSWKLPSVDWFRRVVALTGGCHTADWYDFALYMWYTIVTLDMNLQDNQYTYARLLDRFDWDPSRFKNGFQKLVDEFKFHLKNTPKGRIYERKIRQHEPGLQ